MAPSRTLQVQIIGDPSSFSRATRKVEGDAKRMGDHVDRAGKRVHGFATISSRGFSRVGVAAGGMATAGAGAAVLLAKSFVSGASDINESLTKNQVLFGRYSRDVNEFSKRSAAAFGISRQAALEYTGVFGNLFRATGSARGESAKMSVSLTKLAADMASFNNTSIEDALEAIRSGVVGETEPLRRFGVNLNDAQLRTQALAMGLTHTTKNVLTPHQKAMASVALITKQTAAAHGDFARTSGGLANQQRILTARVKDAASQLGGRLLPAALKAVKGINSLFDSSSKGGRALAGLGRFAGNATNAIRSGFNTATRAVERWIARHQADIQTGVQAMRNLGKAARYVFEEVILPVVRTSIRRIGPVIEGLIDTLSALVRFVTNVLTGRWGKAWDAFKDIVTSSLKTMVRAVRGVADVLYTATRSLGGVIVKGIVAGLKGLAGAIKDAVVGGVKGGVNAAKGAIGSAIDKINPFGDGIGKLGKRIGDGIGANGVLPSGGAFGGSLMGARTSMRPFAAIGSRFGLNVSSGRRPGSITSSGNVSYHSSGEAIDMADGRGPDANKLAYFRYLKSHFGGRLSELIYTPGGAGIKDGRPYTYGGQVAADHYDHVHVAFDTGRRGVGDGLGRFTATSYGPPWGGIQGGGTTATGVDLHNAPHEYGIAVDPSVIPLNSSVKVWPNPFGYRGAFRAFDTGGAIKGHRIDFYDWRGRKSQNAWGSRMVTVSTAGGGGTHGKHATQAPRHSFPVGTVGKGVVGGFGGGGPMAGPTPTQDISDIGLAKATATAQDNLPKLITALTAELTQKRRRKKQIERWLKRHKRMKPARRVVLTDELATLIADIAELRALLKEYRADARGGATTISAAEGLTAGVAPEGSHLSAGGTSVDTDPEAGPTPMDFADAAIAEAGLTPGLQDDIAATQGKLAIAADDLAAARASGDPRKISEAISVWSSINDSLKSLTEAVTLESETRQRLIDELANVGAELKKNNEFSASVAGIATTQAVRALADVISGQIYGPTHNRGLTAGTGALVRMP